MPGVFGNPQDSRGDYNGWHTRIGESGRQLSSVSEAKFSLETRSHTMARTLRRVL